MYKLRTKAASTTLLAAALSVGGMGFLSVVAAQTGTQAPPTQRPQRNQNAPAAEPGTGVGFRLPFPQHPPAPPEVVAQGKNLFEINCAFCHGADAAGGTGPNLLRSQVVIDDKDGELIAPIIHGARASLGMPAIDLTQAQISDVAAFLHSFETGVTEHPAKPINIVVGNATQGKADFDRMCSSCHSVTGDLSGIATKIPNPRALQQEWLLPGGAGRAQGPPQPGRGVNIPIEPMTATVTLPSGQKIEGKLDRIDDFYVGLTTPDGTFRSFLRHGDEPKVVLHDPLAAHRELIGKYTDEEIHDITAYLVTIK